jgi:putative glutamine amidotransferase
VGRPRIGITTYLTEAAWSYWKLPAALIPASYVQSVELAGGSPLLVPPGAGIEETLEAVDGLVFSGGSDLDPQLYGSEAHQATRGVVRERDEFELELMRAALDRDLPVLAICRGSQVLNVARGGGIEQHLPDRLGDEVHRQVPGTFGEHGVDVLPDTRLARIVGPRAAVKSHHHQGFDQLGAGLRESARADDGTLEGVEDPDRRFAIGVLWHPEEDDEKALFAALVAAAAEHRKRVD